MNEREEFDRWHLNKYGWMDKHAFETAEAAQRYEVWLSAKESSRKELEAANILLETYRKNNETLTKRIEESCKELEAEMEAHAATIQREAKLSLELEESDRRIADLEWVEAARDAEVADLREKHGDCLGKIDGLAAEKEALEKKLAEQQAELLRHKNHSECCLIQTDGAEELTKQLAAAREKDASTISEQKRTILDIEAREKMYVEVLKRASTSLGSFCSDEGWAQSDMDTMDAVDATLNAKTNPFVTTEWTACFVAEWVRVNWKPVAHTWKLSPHGENIFSENEVSILIGAPSYKNPQPLYAIPDKE